MKKILFSFLSLAVFSIVLTSSIFAESINQDDIISKDSIYFEQKHDIKKGGGITTQDTCICLGERTPKKISGPVYATKLFDSYLTSYWAKADKYNWTETTTTTWTVSGGPSSDALSKIKTVLNLSVSKSKAYAVGISIPANPAKESKLGLFGDFNRYYVKMSDILERDVSYHNVSEPTDVQYLIVVYK